VGNSLTSPTALTSPCFEALRPPLTGLSMPANVRAKPELLPAIYDPIFRCERGTLASQPLAAALRAEAPSLLSC
jgi:hypothetical protein